MQIKNPTEKKLIGALKFKRNCKVVILDDKTKDIKFDDIIVEYNKEKNCVMLYSSTVHFEPEHFYHGC